MAYTPVMADRPATVEGYLASLPAERRGMVDTLRTAILANLPEGYEEGIQYGMISYYVPLSRYPDTYNGQPLSVASIANQKRYVSAYLHGCYLEAATRTWLVKAVKDRMGKIDMGKSCVRFRKPSDIPPDVVGEAIAKLDVEAFLRLYEASRA